MNEQPEKACCLARQLQRIRTLFDVRNHISSHVFVSIFVSVLIISSILIVSYSMSVLDDLTEVNTQSGRNIVSTISEQIDSNADAVLQTHILLFSSDDVQAYLSQDAASMPSYAWFELYNGARQMITLFGRSQYMTRLRVYHAAYALLFGHTSVSAACQIAGFGGYNHFVSTFKAVTGMTPSEFRKNPAAVNWLLRFNVIENSPDVLEDEEEEPI